MRQQILTGHSSHFGSFKITNTLYNDLYTWEISCSRPYLLEDTFGASYFAQQVDGSYKVTMMSPVVSHGTILHSESKSFQFKILDGMPHIKCNFNGQAMFEASVLPPG